MLKEQYTEQFSKTLFEDAQNYIPGGVNSPVRAFNSVGGEPLFIKKGQGPYLITQDDNRYIDYVCSWGPLILGHSHPKVVDAVKESVGNGLSFGAPIALEVEFAKTITQLVPNVEMVRTVSSGTEAAMTAIRLARGATGKNKIIKFEGCYHGHVDSLLVSAGSGSLTLTIPGTAGVPEGAITDTLVVPYNNLEAVEQLFQRFGDEIAGVILEPVAANMNLVPATEEFAKGLRDLCSKNNSLLIFDEVITGFRMGLAGAQQKYHVSPDLLIFGKIIGGGMPVGAVAGRADIMSSLAPVGNVYQAGTLSGNPISLTAGISTLRELTSSEFYYDLMDRTVMLADGIEQAAKAHNLSVLVNKECGMLGLFFTDKQQILNYDDVASCDIERYKQLHQLMLAQGVYLAPSAFEIMFVSIAHDEPVIKSTIDAFDKAFEIISKS